MLILEKAQKLNEEKSRKGVYIGTKRTELIKEMRDLEKQKAAIIEEKQAVEKEKKEVQEVYNKELKIIKDEHAKLKKRKEAFALKEQELSVKQHDLANNGQQLSNEVDRLKEQIAKLNDKILIEVKNPLYANNMNAFYSLPSNIMKIEKLKTEFDKEIDGCKSLTDIRKLIFKVNEAFLKAQIFIFKNKRNVFLNNNCVTYFKEYQEMLEKVYNKADLAQINYKKSVQNPQRITNRFKDFKKRVEDFIDKYPIYKQQDVLSELESFYKESKEIADKLQNEALWEHLITLNVLLLERYMDIHKKTPTKESDTRIIELNNDQIKYSEQHLLQHPFDPNYYILIVMAKLGLIRTGKNPITENLFKEACLSYQLAYSYSDKRKEEDTVFELAKVEIRYRQTKFKLEYIDLDKFCLKEAPAKTSNVIMSNNK